MKKKFLGAIHETKKHLCFFWKNPTKAKVVGRAEVTGKKGKEGWARRDNIGPYKSMKGFGFYSKCDGKLLEAFEQGFK